MRMYADDKMRQNYNDFKQKNHNITVMSFDILADYILHEDRQIK